jgi:hypothetical protein
VSECNNKQVQTFGFPQGTLNEIASVFPVDRERVSVRVSVRVATTRRRIDLLQGALIVLEKSPCCINEQI